MPQTNNERFTASNPPLRLKLRAKIQRCYCHCTKYYHTPRVQLRRNRMLPCDGPAVMNSTGQRGREQRWVPTSILSLIYVQAGSCRPKSILYTRLDQTSNLVFDFLVREPCRESDHGHFPKRHAAYLPANDSLFSWPNSVKYQQVVCLPQHVERACSPYLA